MPVLKNVGKVAGNKCQPEGQNELYMYLWLIKKFRKLYNSIGGWHESPVFSTGREYEWKLKVYVDGYDETAKEYVGIEVDLKKKVTQHHPIFTVECAIVTEDGKKHMIKGTIVTNTLLNEYAVTFKNFVSKYELSNEHELLPYGELLISCRITLDKSNKSNKDKDTVVQSVQKNQLEVFEKFFNSEKFSDFQFVVGSKRFHVHRLILAARSPVFEAMFNSNMRESSERKVHIDDIEPDVMEKLLRFVYVGEADVGNLADKVFIAADKYQLDELKLLCEDTLGRELNVDNVYGTLQLAEKYSADELKKKAMEFFSKNMQELSSQANFQASVSSLPPALQTQIICTFAKMH